MRNRANIARHELIGLEIEVISATDKKQIGMVGTISDETKNTFLVMKKKTTER